MDYHKFTHHFTASAVVIANEHILLVNHRRIGAWVPPGGHIDAQEMPHVAAVREVYEETGIAVQVISEPVPKTGDPEAFFLPQPLCIQAVSAIEKGTTYFHIDIAFMCSLISTDIDLPKIVARHEVKEAKWVGLCELNEKHVQRKIKLARNVPEIIRLAKIKLNLPDN